VEEGWEAVELAGRRRGGGRCSSFFELVFPKPFVCRLRSHFLPDSPANTSYPPHRRRRPRFITTSKSTTSPNQSFSRLVLLVLHLPLLILATSFLLVEPNLSNHTKSTADQPPSPRRSPSVPPSTLRRCSYAFIEFRSEACAEDAYFDMHGRSIDGRRISVQVSFLSPSPSPLHNSITLSFASSSLLFPRPFSSLNPH